MITAKAAHVDGAPTLDVQRNKNNVAMYYQRFAISKAADYGDPLFQAKLWILALGGEIGELANLTKKWLGHSHTLGRDKVKDELSDCFWYVAVLCDLIDANFNTFIREAVIVPTAQDTRIRTLNYCLALQTAQGVAASVALYTDKMDSMEVTLRSPLQRIGALLIKLTEEHSFTLEDVLLHNVIKLNARYPQGFSAERSINRAN